MKACGRCKARKHCSKECQRKDWEEHKHSVWCGHSGELGVDYEIRDAGGSKGLGVYALRPFARAEKVMVERPLTLSPFQQVPAEQAVDALLPAHGTVREKFMLNNISCSDETEVAKARGLFVTMSRVNHDCIGNCMHHYRDEQGLKLLVASRSIATGEEITFAYVHGPRSVRRAKLRIKFEFGCSCEACSNAELNAKLERSLELNDKVFELGSSGREADAVRAGEALLALYDELGESDKLRVATCYDLFQMSIIKQSTLAKGKWYARRAAELAEQFYGANYKDTLKFATLAEHPEGHVNYLAKSR
jgi:MYND finger/SET domain